MFWSVPIDAQGRHCPSPYAAAINHKPSTEPISASSEADHSLFVCLSLCPGMSMGMGMAWQAWHGITPGGDPRGATLPPLLHPAAKSGKAAGGKMAGERTQLDASPRSWTVYGAMPSFSVVPLASHIGIQVPRDWISPVQQPGFGFSCLGLLVWLVRLKPPPTIAALEMVYSDSGITRTTPGLELRNRLGDARSYLD